ncbi:branched-chain amino acid aminotransferase [Streptomyces profundus]|uniref:branched-chain amino acid aminotransferase n=1 Tax=Streptomyces profundus TaxID=2867410 RepID=UPI001D1694D0|nr:branched-chain amino acid aminotransferase [Streptomyces sp. MA3_2.13]UED86828.1 branched-chain amino acid aminotransferase [Streptomyces sp. MA3_2.13]
MTTSLPFDRKLAAQPRSDADREAALVDPGFGNHFTDHMVTIRWTEEQGWHEARLQPYAPLPMDPATMVFHYSQEIFEGLKAYRQADGSVAVFRPEANAERFQRSARRMAMPELPVELFVEAIDVLVGQDSAWVPASGEQSLYLRPFMIASEVGLGINRPANEYLFVVIASPAGAYFPRGIKPVSVWLSQEYVRAAPGGTGEAKTGGNYAAAFLAQAEATEQGCDQVVWLDAVERRWVEEMGGMNLYFVRGGGADTQIVTPQLSGTLLPGITRDSLLRIASDLGYSTGEVKISTDDWREGSASGAITEVFACGTAAVITPVGSVKSAEARWEIGDGQPGPVTLRLREELLGIQTGQRPDPYGWMHPVA